ncbi:shikimate kinase [Sporichthya sp.]|uniref:shikimate kinase n=1 Tax=Sporichthya sp. TaxID=65475 RepID=UPI00179D6921|nr:shikimate kinase [Sporichthya sp.]MBA3741713.1 shikimate kinase [Sporichthya sp.]
MERIALLGLMGSGKTTVGERLALRLGWTYRDNDGELLARFGASAAQLKDRNGLDALHAAEAAVLLDLLNSEERSVLTAAASTVESLTCRRVLAERAFVVWLRADARTLAARATEGSGRPWNDDVEAQLRTQVEYRYPLLEQLADLTVDTTDLDGERVAEQIAEAVSSPVVSSPAGVPAAAGPRRGRPARHAG